MNKTQKQKILVVEDEMIIAADLSMELESIGYQVISIQTRAEDAIAMLTTNQPDLILMDIVLAGEMDGIDAAKHILDNFQIPVVFLTSNTDDATFQRALEAKPYAFVAKPFQIEILARNLKIAFQHIASQQIEQEENKDHVSTLDDRLFIRHKDKMVKVTISEILFLEADRNYCKIYTLEKEYLVSTPLGNVEEQISSKKFIKVHRSFVVNLSKIDAIGENKEYLILNDHNIPISRRNREDVLQRLKLL